MLGICVGPSQIDRLTQYYGGSIAPDLQESMPADRVDEKVVYAQADGAMLLTDEGYKEAKLGRIFAASCLQQSVVEERGGHISESIFVAHLGKASDFCTKFETQLEPYKDLDSDLVFISDGAVWLRQMMEKSYPKATLILDLYHALEHISEAGSGAFGTEKKASDWLDCQRKLLLNSELDAILVNIRQLPIRLKLQDSVCSYLESNRGRMDYKAYRKRGLLIGSGAIESAHRTVMQRRLKRSGQRWSVKGAQHVLNLRVCQMSNRWHLVRQLIEPLN